ncbi:nucleoside transporter family protein, putative [Ichthyophthirius multifiliis]|uniref:Nucleoside transporter family protein, putative n=1 Tax=Ichthyophthirius multifiliis TaxID=5932 RepID=G0QYF0_ICHMU|nr:nucleoside transporter family protein, putative [Ichthyophthirius multifiliis]EGR29759.1 nucleoside transporter family protein, putative [Ichthyophthirius multifiliis]|eukprot:XP_004030995.1 nucleoside transporter family protein, putative [Ichthyophthirius multifiliis]
MQENKIEGIEISQNHLPKKPIEEVEEDYEKLPPITLFHKITLALLGICSLTGWNSILNAFDFFQAKFPKNDYVDVAFYFPIPIMCTNFLVGVTLTLIGNKIPIEKRIPFALRGAVLTLVSICLVGIYLKQTQAGIAIVFIILILQGIFDSLITNSSVALSGATQSGVLISIYWTFTALSGIIMNVLRFIAFGAFGLEDLDNGTGLYFGVATGFYITGSICFTIFTNCDYYKAVLKRDQMKNKKQEEQQNQATPNAEKEIFKIQDNKIVAGPAPFFIFTNYVQTFMLFPGVSVFQKPQYTLIEFPYALVFMFMIYNIGDFTGKTLGGIQFLQKSFIAYSVVISRFSYFILFILIAQNEGSKDMQNDLFQFFLLFTFALTNGMITTILMTVAPQRATNVQDRYLISYVNIFSLTFGISIGSFMALILAKN